MAEESRQIDNAEEENSVTMLDVLQEEHQLEEDANAVLGASDDKNCTYSKGYIRQALYACNTCCPGGKEPAGVCLACSFHCHEGHELIELYTKRHFRCDCGNSKFKGKKCTLDSAKAEVNAENKYNQNFTGVYCTCHRPYPDPEDTSNDDEMLQCAICEDWYHSKHLNVKAGIPDEHSYDEVVCPSCMKEHDFLWGYAPQYSVGKSIKEDSKKDESIDVTTGETDSCKLPEKIEKEEGGCFWAEGWRAALCKCDECKKMYEEKEIAFLIDPTDSVQVYEEAGKQVRGESAYEKGMKALASLGHVEQVNVIEEYNIMKEQLKEYLQKFAENKKVVREEDIKEFFSSMESNKRQKVSVPSHCR